MATDSIEAPNEMKEKQTVEFLKQKYKWDINQKLGASPFRIKIKKLKEENKKNPSMKKSNNEFKRLLKSKEKELLSEFQKKCQQAKAWINDAHNEHNQITNTTENEQIKAYNLKKEKIETIDQFWDELICKQTVFLQQQQIITQQQQMNDLEQQTKQLQQQLNKLNNMKKNSQKNNTYKIDTENSNKNSNNLIKKKKKKKDKNKNKYQGLIGYFNRPQKQKKENKNVTTNAQNKNEKNDDEKEVINEVKVEQKSTETVVESDNIKKKVKNSNNKKGSMKGGFLKANTGLYSDKPKPDSELTVKERNAKNAKQIEEMGLKEATDNPIFTWEKPKEGGIKEKDSKSVDPLTAYLNQTYEQTQTQTQTKD